MSGGGLACGWWWAWTRGTCNWVQFGWAREVKRVGQRIVGGASRQGCHQSTWPRRAWRAGGQAGRQAGRQEGRVQSCRGIGQVPIHRALQNATQQHPAEACEAAVL